MEDLKFIKPKVNAKIIDGNPNKVQYTISPLERGFGNTIGTSLRRILLSSLPGTSIVSAKIDGIKHEFENLEGVIEDTTTIILNLKRIILKSDNIDPTFETTLELNCSKGEVRASDIIIKNSDVEIVNKDQYIATVAQGGRLSMILKVRNGFGYVSSEENEIYLKDGKDEFHAIAIDSIYSPIKNVSMEIEKTRVYNDASYDKLTLNVETNGAISGIDAVEIASKMAIEHFTSIISNPKILNTEYMVESQKDKDDNKLDRRIEDLDFESVRTYNSLKRAGLETVKDIVSKSRNDILKIKNLGKTTFMEVENKIKELGLDFKEE